ncbi:MAG: DUF2065 domain-containing protein [Pseudomonadota bacterium]
MNLSDFAAAFALYLILEGLLPFASPRLWRDAVASIAAQPESRIRQMGLISMGAGLILLYLVR